MEKICIKCKENKNINLFSSNEKSKDKKRNICKKCLNEQSKKYNKKSRLKNKEKIAEGQKKYRKEHAIKLQKYSKEYRAINNITIKKNQRNIYLKDKIKRLEYAKKYRLENNELKKLRDKEYRNNNKEKIKTKAKNNRNITNLKRIKKYKNNIIFKLRIIISNNIKRTLRTKKPYNNNKTIEILGCSITDFKIYIENQFKSWMTWENYGLYNGTLNFGWDLDHIIPISLAKNDESIIKLNHYTNFQPLCSYTNRDIKKNKLL